MSLESKINKESDFCLGISNNSDFYSRIDNKLIESYSPHRFISGDILTPWKEYYDESRDIKEKNEIIEVICLGLKKNISPVILTKGIKWFEKDKEEKSDEYKRILKIGISRRARINFYMYGYKFKDLKLLELAVSKEDRRRISNRVDNAFYKNYSKFKLNKSVQTAINFNYFSLELIYNIKSSIVQDIFNKFARKYYDKIFRNLQKADDLSIIEKRLNDIPFKKNKKSPKLNLHNSDIYKDLLMQNPGNNELKQAEKKPNTSSIFKLPEAKPYLMPDTELKELFAVKKLEKPKKPQPKNNKKTLL